MLLNRLGGLGNMKNNFVVYSRGKVGTTTIHETLNTDKSGKVRSVSRPDSMAEETMQSFLSKIFSTKDLEPGEFKHSLDMLYEGLLGRWYLNLQGHQTPESPHPTYDNLCRTLRGLDDETMRTKLQAYIESLKQYRVNLDHMGEPALSSEERPQAMIISGVRDPVAWTLSNHFEGRRTLGMEDMDAYKRAPEEYCREIAAAVQEQAKQRIDDQEPFSWFDREANPVLGQDIYTQSFDREAGFGVYETDKFKWLVYKMETWVSRSDELLNDVFGLQTELVSGNITSERLGDIFKYTKNQFKLSREILEAIYGEKFSFFYTDTEREAFINKWAVEVPPSP